MAEAVHGGTREGVYPGGGDSDPGDSPSALKDLASWDKAVEIVDYIATRKDYVDDLLCDTVAQHLRRIAATCPSPVVLDVAGGTGRCAVKAAQRFPQAQITITDLSSAMAEIMKCNVEEAGVENIVATKVMDGQDMNLVQDGSVDVLTCNLGFFCFQDRGRGWREIHRVLKPGGRAVLVTWATLSPQLLSREALAKYDLEEEGRGVEVGIDERKRREVVMSRFERAMLALKSPEDVTLDLAAAACQFSRVECYVVSHLWEGIAEADREKMTSPRSGYLWATFPGFKQVVAGRDMEGVMSKVDEVMRSRLNEKRNVVVPWRELFTVLTK